MHPSVGDMAALSNKATHQQLCSCFWEMLQQDPLLCVDYVAQEPVMTGTLFACHRCCIST